MDAAETGHSRGPTHIRLARLGSAPAERPNFKMSGTIRRGLL